MEYQNIIENIYGRIICLNGWTKTSPMYCESKKYFSENKICDSVKIVHGVSKGNVFHFLLMAEKEN